MSQIALVPPFPEVIWLSTPLTQLMPKKLVNSDFTIFLNLDSWILACHAGACRWLSVIAQDMLVL